MDNFMELDCAKEIFFSFLGVVQNQENLDNQR